MDSPIFYGLTLTNLATLFVIGTAWSAVVWILTEAIRIRAGWDFPHTVERKRRLISISMILAVSGTWILFPWALEGVGGSVPEPALTAAFGRWFVVVTLLGIAGGLGCKGAHDFAYPLVSVLLGRIASFLGGKKP